MMTPEKVFFKIREIPDEEFLKTIGSIFDRYTVKKRIELMVGQDVMQSLVIEAEYNNTPYAIFKAPDYVIILPVVSTDADSLNSVAQLFEEKFKKYILSKEFR